MDSSSPSPSKFMDAKSPQYSDVIFGGSQFQEQSSAKFDTVVDMSSIEEDFGQQTVPKRLANGGEGASSPMEKPRPASANNAPTEYDLQNPDHLLASSMVSLNPFAFEQSGGNGHRKRLSFLRLSVSHSSDTDSSEDQDEDSDEDADSFVTAIPYRTLVDEENNDDSVIFGGEPNQNQEPNQSLQEEPSNFGKNISFFLGMICVLVVFSYGFYKLLKAHYLESRTWSS